MQEVDSSSQGPGLPQAQVSVVVPVYNEENAILETCRLLSETLATTGWDWEVICVNDGSKDGSSAVLKQLIGVPNMVVVEHDVNKGYGAALKTGIRKARYPWIAIIDADGTYSMEALKSLLPSAANYDMVVGSRTGPNVKYSPIRRIPKFFLRRIASFLAGSTIPDMNSGLRLFRRDIVQRFFPILSDRFSFTTSITMAFLTSGYHVLFIPIDYSERVGQSKIRPIRDTIHFSQLILRTGMYFAPMKVLMPLAYVLGGVALASLAYDLIELKNLTDKTILMAMFSMNTAIFALLADMIQKIWKMR